MSSSSSSRSGCCLAAAEQLSRLSHDLAMLLAVLHCQTKTHTATHTRVLFKRFVAYKKGQLLFLSSSAYFTGNKCEVAAFVYDSALAALGLSSEPVAVADRAKTHDKIKANEAANCGEKRKRNGSVTSDTSARHELRLRTEAAAARGCVLNKHAHARAAHTKTNEVRCRSVCLASGGAGGAVGCTAELRAPVNERERAQESVSESVRAIWRRMRAITFFFDKIPF